MNYGTGCAYAEPGAVKMIQILITDTVNVYIAPGPYSLVFTTLTVNICFITWLMDELNLPAVLRFSISACLLLLLVCGSTLSCMMRSAESTAWKPRSALSEGFFLALWPGSIRIRSAGRIFGFPQLVYSPRYSRGGWQGRRLPSPACLLNDCDIGRQILVLININVNAKCIHLEVNSGNLTKDI